MGSLPREVIAIGERAETVGAEVLLAMGQVPGHSIELDERRKCSRIRNDSALRIMEMPDGQNFGKLAITHGLAYIPQGSLCILTGPGSFWFTHAKVFQGQLSKTSRGKSLVTRCCKLI